MQHKVIFRLALTVSAAFVLLASQGVWGGELVAWGWNDYGQCDVPPGNDYVAVSGGDYHSIALKSNGSLAAWGRNQWGQCNVPVGSDYVAIAAGYGHSLALKANGSLVAWGRNDNGESAAPAGNDFVAIAAAPYFFSLALKSDGSMVGWGSGNNGQSEVPSGNNFVAIDSGAYHCVAIKGDGSLINWGLLTEVPNGNDFVAIRAGSYHNFAQKSDGLWLSWGTCGDNRCEIPSGTNFSAIVGGYVSSLGLKTDGTLVAWGNNIYGQCDVPTGNDFVEIDSSPFHCLAIRDSGELPPDPTTDPIAYYPFNGNANDETGNGHDGTVYGATLTSDRFGNANSAYRFDGVDDYIQVFNTSGFGFNNNSFSVSLWVQIVNNTNTLYDHFICLSDSSNGLPHFSISKHRLDEKRMYTEVWTTSGQSILYCNDTGEQLPKNTWLHLVSIADCEEDKLKFYIDGSLQEEGDLVDFDFSTASALELYIGYTGYWSGLATPHYGLIDDVRIYNKALSDTEISALYNTPEPSTPPVADANGPYTLFAGDTLTLDASGSTDDENDITSYVWDLDDDGVFETDAGTQAVFDVSYAYLESLGTLINVDYNIHLKVTDGDEQADTDTTTLTVEPKPALVIAVDIKPTSCPNPLNVKSKGVLPVAILGSDSFDVATIVISSLRLAGVAPLRDSYEDVATPVGDVADCNCIADGPDGFLDLALKFETQQIVETLGEVKDGDVITLELTGVGFGEIPIEGADCIIIRGRRKPFNKGDINKDGVVNMLDFSMMSGNWQKSSIVDD